MIYEAKIMTAIESTYKGDKKYYRLLVHERANETAARKVAKHRASRFFEVVIRDLIHLNNTFELGLDDVPILDEHGEVVDNLIGDFALMARLKWGFNV